MSDNDEQLIPTPSDFGHFLLEKELGHGGMGGVYLARDKMLDRQVGIKVMLKSLGDDPAFVERFQREAQAAARLNHPNIAQIYSFGKENGMPYIAMELVSGGSLDKEMEANPGTLDPVHVMRVGQQLADALALAAEQGLVHGDVKPENVLYDVDGNAKLVDFGLAAMQGDSNEIWGTPYYISPEKVRRQKVDFRADIYSLGGTLYHALTGVAPFEGETAAEVVKARFNGPPRKPSEVRADIPPEIDTIIMRMLEVEPSMRYPTYQSLLGDFKRYLSKAGPAKKIGKVSGTKVKIKGTKMKVNLAGEASGSALPADLNLVEGEEGEQPDGKKPLNIGLVVGLVALGVLLLIGLVVGGLFWYMHAEKAAKERAAQQQIVDTQARARKAIATSMQAIESFGEKFHELVAKSDKEAADAVREVRALVPANLKDVSAPFLEPPPTQDIADAIAFTNALFTAAAAQAKADQNAQAAEAKAKAEEAKAAAGTNATAQASAGTNTAAKAAAPEKKDDAKKPDAKDAKKEAEKKEAAEEAPAEEEKAPEVEIPVAIKQFAELWADVYASRAADIRVQGSIKLLLEKGKAAEKLVNADEETARALGKISTQLVEGFEQIKGMKCVEQTQRKASAIRTKSTSLVRAAQSQIKRMLDKQAREAKAKEEAAEKEAAAKKAAEEHKERAEAETKNAQETFDELVGDRLKYLEWEKATEILKKVQAEVRTEEGREEIRSQLEKVRCMQALHEILIEKSKDFTFKNGTVVVSSDAKGLTLQEYRRVKGKKVAEGKPNLVEWRRFYGKAEYVGQMSQLLNHFVLRGRDTVHTGPMQWSRQMLGAALTLNLLYTEAKGAAEFAPVFVKKAAKDFEDCKTWATKWFPDVDLEAE